MTWTSMATFRRREGAKGILAAGKDHRAGSALTKDIPEKIPLAFSPPGVNLTVRGDRGRCVWAVPRVG
jgi:hypothetical protein